MLSEQLFALARYGHDLTLWILIIMSVVSVAFILERFITLKAIREKSLSMTRHIQEALQTNSLNEIEDIARDRDSFVGRALAYGLRHTKEHGAKGLEEIFQCYALNEKPNLEKRLNFLATVGSNAPFIGLLGTVFGIMNAFRALAISQGEISAVMIGISEALVATAVGLAVAIPAVIAYNAFRKQVNYILQSLESAKDICVAYAKTSKGAPHGN